MYDQLGLGSIEPHGKLLMANYALTTPTVFLRLLFENRISKPELQHIFENVVPNLPEAWQEFYKVIPGAILAMESQRAQIYPFLAKKAREGNLQVLSVWMQHWNPNRQTDIQSLEAFWQECWQAFCDYWKTTPQSTQGTKRGNCDALFDIIRSLA
jgi:hypothetical protein